MTDSDRSGDVPGSYRPTADEVDDLIRRAASHRLGTDFLLHGTLDAVAATFQAHAFVVEAARDILADTPHRPEIKTTSAAARAATRA